jgi:hypothetical protein
VSINIDGVLYLRIMDPYKASYGVEDPEFAITQLAQTTMRSELGKISLGTYVPKSVPYNLEALCEVAGKFVVIVWYMPYFFTWVVAVPVPYYNKQFRVEKQRRRLISHLGT